MSKARFELELDCVDAGKTAKKIDLDVFVPLADHFEKDEDVIEVWGMLSNMSIVNAVAFMRSKKFPDEAIAEWMAKWFGAFKELFGNNGLMPHFEAVAIASVVRDKITSLGVIPNDISVFGVNDFMQKYGPKPPKPEGDKPDGK